MGLILMDLKAETFCLHKLQTFSYNWPSETFSDNLFHSEEKICHYFYNIATLKLLL